MPKQTEPITADPSRYPVKADRLFMRIGIGMVSITILAILMCVALSF
ncbi:hypothetical protein FHW19_004197 [Ochrobactrum anthropi]|nr:hypothetical protein [Brucella anthropi]